MISYKNRLQEWCQKNNKSLPIYSSKSKGEDHCLQWSANATVIINEKAISATCKPKFSTKIAAEQYVAKKLLNKICKNDIIELNNIDNLSSSSPNSPSSPNSLSSSSSTTINSPRLSMKISPKSNNIRIINLIDLENKPYFDIKCNPNTLYIGCISATHSTLPKYVDWLNTDTDKIADVVKNPDNRLLLYMIEGGVVDLVDHYMTCLIYPIINYVKTLSLDPEEIINIRIITGDKAGYCTRICFEKIISWENLKQIKMTNHGSI